MNYLCKILRYTFTVGLKISTLLTLNLAVDVAKIVIHTESYLTNNKVLCIKHTEFFKALNLIKMFNCDLKSFNCSNQRSIICDYLNIYGYKFPYPNFNYAGRTKDNYQISYVEFIYYESTHPEGFIMDSRLLHLPDTLESLKCDNTQITGSCFEYFKCLKFLSCAGCVNLDPKNLNKVRERGVKIRYFEEID